MAMRSYDKYILVCLPYVKMLHILISEFDIVFLNKTQEGITINVSNIEIVRNFKLSMWIRLADMSDQFQVVYIDDGNTNVGIVYYEELFYLLGSW